MLWVTWFCCNLGFACVHKKQINKWFFFKTSVFLTCVLHKHTYKISLKHTCVIDKHTEQTLTSRQWRLLQTALATGWVAHFDQYSSCAPHDRCCYLLAVRRNAAEHNISSWHSWVCASQIHLQVFPLSWQAAVKFWQVHDAVYTTFELLMMGGGTAWNM
jgi:hypothetical protein